MPNRNKKVGVALSGGVDSSVACALLKKQGFEVVGFFMNLWIAQGGCCSIEDQERARKVAEILKIPFYVVNFSDSFKKGVVEYFLAEIKKGKTPNPCVVCNKEIKFGLLLEKAQALGCDYLATGHYAKTKDGKLFRAKNLEKDQTYFLWKLGQKELAKILFPLGEIESKQKVRELAKKFGLPTYKTPESNDVCFLAQTNLQQFLTQITATGLPQAGKIVDMGGNALGQHKGLWFYTIGQRKGIELSGGPYFVVEKDIKKNILVVSKNENDLLKKELVAQEVNWASGVTPTVPLKVLAKVRYGTEPASAIIKEKLGPKKYKVVFTKSQRAITPGQSVVFYGKGNELLGGGIIE
ncbi:MAG: tRNA 2-thiouridine(34) synthase MnmA [bacterium]|nr:tRNA 2-thiouridine(34) synthase MnmA [bacterium]